VAPAPGLSNLATPTKAIITIPITLYKYGNGDDAEEGGPRERNGREHGEHKRDEVRRCSCSTEPLRAGVAHHAHWILVQPVQAGLLAQPWRRTRPQGLCQVSIFYTVLVKKSQQANGASELLRIIRPRTRK
jgi:hypothetical protein